MGHGRRPPPESALRTAPPVSTLAGYPGAKAGSGVAHRIIGQMPPHNFYVEAFLGSGVILRLKRPAAGGTVGIDVDRGICEHWQREFCIDRPDVTIQHGNAIRALPSLSALLANGGLVYADPPYLKTTRSHGRLYKHELWTEAEHRQLLLCLLELPCAVMLSGYPSPLYAAMLEAAPRPWRFIDYPVMTRGGRKLERLWMNFPAADVLHDPRFAGNGYRDRERVAKKRRRWAAKFAAMPQWERQLVREALDLAAPPKAAGGSGPAAPGVAISPPLPAWAAVAGPFTPPPKNWPVVRRQAGVAAAARRDRTPPALALGTSDVPGQLLMDGAPPQ